MAALLALAAMAGAPWLLLAAVGLAVVSPWAFLGCVAVWAVLGRRRRRSPSRPDLEAAFLRALAADLSAGASIRRAVATAARRAPALEMEGAVRLAEAGMPAGHIGEAIGKSLVSNGVAAAAAFRLAATSGAPAGPVFESLARRAEDHGRLERERRSLTAQARLSAWIVGGGPIALTALGYLTGLGPGRGGLSGAGTLVTVIGLAMIAGGALVVWLMIRGAER